MAYSEVYINNDFDKLKTVLDSLVTNGIVGAVGDVTWSDNKPNITVYIDSAKTKPLFYITKKTAMEASYTTFDYQFTDATGRTLLKSVPSVNSQVEGFRNYSISRGYITDYGVVIAVSGWYSTGSWVMSHAIMITKNQNNVPVVVFTVPPSASRVGADYVYTTMNTEYAFASDDTETLDGLTRTNVAYNAQTVITPFFTRCGAGLVSYTPNAGRLLACNFWRLLLSPTFSEMTFDGAVWLTNGCWCLKAG